MSSRLATAVSFAREPNKPALPLRKAVENTGYVRSMYQMICPVLEGLQDTEGLDASDDADSGTDTRPPAVPLAMKEA